MSKEYLVIARLPTHVTGTFVSKKLLSQKAGDKST